MALVRLILFLIFLSLVLGGCYTTSLPGHSAVASRSKAHIHSRTYIVRKGDTLYRIGRRFGVGYHVIARRNHLRPPYPIYVGQRIYLDRIAPPPSYLPIRKAKKSGSGLESRTDQRRNSGVRDSRPDPRFSRMKPGTIRRRGRKAVARHTKVRLQWPVQGRVTSYFGMRHRRMHDGIDISARIGTPIHAAASGEVVYSDHRLSGYGRLIIIRHSRDLFTAYAHNQRNLVRKGDRVQAGTVIARSGRSGNTNGPHLHFEVRRGETPVDPIAYLPRK